MPNKKSMLDDEAEKHRRDLIERETTGEIAPSKNSPPKASKGAIDRIKAMSKKELLLDLQMEKEAQMDRDMNEAAARKKKAEGGSMLVAPEMDMPVDTFTPEEQANAESSQLPDDEMEEDYMDYVLGESLDDGEQEYLMGALESDPRLSEIFDKVVTTASEFSGAGEVEGPGTGVSDSIPARLSDGEFVVTEEATSEIGADNLQTMMDDAERKASGGVTTRSTYQMGGLLENPSQPLEEEDEDLVAQSMISANQMPSLMGGRR